MDFQLTDEQEVLVDRVKKWYRDYNQGITHGEHPQIYCYSGKAGTGKTTVARAIIDELHLENNYVATAYVGKAVMRLQQTGLVAQTIHSLIYNVLFINEPVDMGGYIVKKKKLIFQLKEELPEWIKLIIVDEGTMVNDDMLKELVSFNIPILMMGDHNQLPPVYGKCTIMDRPNFILTKIMRQKENDPIVILANMVLQDIPLIEGVYGKSRVMRSYEMGPNFLTDYDQCICATNNSRDIINDYVRDILLHRPSKAPCIGDKVVCRQNNWDLDILGFNLTNGMSGYITDIDRSTARKGCYTIDFKPDLFDDPRFDKYSDEELTFKGIEIDRKYITSDYQTRKEFGITNFEKFEYAHAITVYTAQGSEWNRGLYLHSFFVNQDLTRATDYTAITRFKESIDIVIQKYRKVFYR